MFESFSVQVEGWYSLCMEKCGVLAA